MRLFVKMTTRSRCLLSCQAKRRRIFKVWSYPPVGSVCRLNFVFQVQYVYHCCLSLLISLLHREARLTSLQIRLVSERKLRRIQRKKFRNLQTKIFALWDAFNSGDCSARKLLKACSHLNGPAAS